MMLQLETAHLLAALTAVERATDSRTTLPILEHVLCKPEPGSLILTATNLDHSVSTTIPCKIIGAPEAFSLPLKLARRVVASLAASRSKADLSIQTKETKTDGLVAVLTSGSNETTLRRLPAEEFPVIEPFRSNVNGSGSFMLTRPQLAAGLRRCSPCVSSDISRLVINSISIHLFKSGTAAFVSTDSRRLAELPVTVNLDHVPMIGADATRVLIIPRQTLKLLDALVSDEERMDESIAVRFDSQRVEFRSGDQTILAKQLEGYYPNYAQVIPPGYVHSYDVDRAELSSFLSALATFANDKVSGVRIEPAEDGSGRLQFSMVNPESGEGRTLVQCEPPCRDLQPVTLNIDYLRSFLASHPTDRVTLHFSGPADPVGGTTVPPDGRMVIMPMRHQ